VIALLDLVMRPPEPIAVSSRFGRIAIAVLLTAAAVACSSSDPANPAMPSGPSFAGTWAGMVKPAAVAGNLQLTLESSLQPVSGPAQYSGRWTIAFPDSRDNTSGLAAGRAFASLLTLTLQPGLASGCMITFSGTLDSSGTRIDGSISSMSCDGASTSITLSKQ